MRKPGLALSTNFDSVLEFRSDGFDAPMGPAADSIYGILRHLAEVMPEAAATRGSFLDELAAEPDIFKIIVTRRSRAAIPASLWTSSYIVFLGD